MMYTEVHFTVALGVVPGTMVTIPLNCAAAVCLLPDPAVPGEPGLRKCLFNPFCDSK